MGDRVTETDRLSTGEDNANEGSHTETKWRNCPEFIPCWSTMPWEGLPYIDYCNPQVITEVAPSSHGRDVLREGGSIHTLIKEVSIPLAR